MKKLYMGTFIAVVFLWLIAFVSCARGVGMGGDFLWWWW